MPPDFHQPRPSELNQPNQPDLGQPEGQNLQAPVQAPAPPTSLPIARAAVIDPELFEQRCGQAVNPRAFEVEPQGNRILVVVDPVPKKVGLIAVPDDVADREVMGQGWVLAAGPMAGVDMPYPGGPICTPDQLIGQHVYFGAYTGKALRFSLFDRKYKGRVLVMADRDVWCVDWNPDPQAAERQFQDDLDAHLNQVETDRTRIEDEAAQRLADARVKLAGGIGDTGVEGLGARKP